MGITCHCSQQISTKEHKTVTINNDVLIQENKSTNNTTCRKEKHIQLTTKKRDIKRTKSLNILSPFNKEFPKKRVEQSSTKTIIARLQRAKSKTIIRGSHFLINTNISFLLLPDWASLNTNSLSLMSKTMKNKKIHKLHAYTISVAIPNNPSQIELEKCLSLNNDYYLIWLNSASESSFFFLRNIYENNWKQKHKKMNSKMPNIILIWNNENETDWNPSSASSTNDGIIKYCVDNNIYNTSLSISDSEEIDKIISVWIDNYVSKHLTWRDIM